jgi:hypothetical protein
MWIVANQLKGVVRFPGFGIEIPPDGEYDLDSVGREKAEGSVQIKLALENAYLKTVRKTVMIEEADLQKLIEERIAAIKQNLVSEIGALVQPKA